MKKDKLRPITQDEITQDETRPITHLEILRKELGLTQKEIANNLNCDIKTYRNYEKGNSIPGSGLLMEMYAYYKKKGIPVSMDYILGLSEFRTPENDFIGSCTGLSDESIQNLKILRVFGVHSYAQTINFLLKKNHITLDPPQISQKDDKGLLSLLASYFVMEPDIKVEGITDNAITEIGSDGKRIILNGSDLIGGALFNLIQEKVIEYRSEINNTRKQK